MSECAAQWLERLRSRPWPSRSRILDVAETDAMHGPGSARIQLEHYYDPWGGVTGQELAFAEAMVLILGAEAVDALYHPEYERAAQLGERPREAWEREQDARGGGLTE